MRDDRQEDHCPAEVITTVSPDPIATTSSALTTTRRMPKRSISAAANGAVSPYSATICTGAFVLARAGRLDDRPATTHWLHAELFAARFPQVRLHPDVLYVDDGDVLTSAGNAAGIDLLLHVVRRDHGSAVATRIARRRVVPPWREGGQSQFVDSPVPDPTGPGTAATRAWAVDRLDQPLTLGQLAGYAAMTCAPSPGASARRPGSARCAG